MAGNDIPELIPSDAPPPGLPGELGAAQQFVDQVLVPVGRAIDPRTAPPNSAIAAPGSPPMIRIDEPFGISAAPNEPPIPANIPLPESVTSPPPVLRSVPRHSPAAPPATTIPVNPDGLMAPADSSIREPTSIEKVASAEEEKAKLQDQQAEAAAQQADAEAKAAEARAEQQRKDIEEQDRLISQQRDAMLESKRQGDEAKQETKNFKFHNYWADKSTGQRVLSAIAVMLGGVSWDQNHVNQVAASIDTDIAQDFKKQEAELARRQENERTARQNRIDLVAQHQEEWNKLKFKQGEQLKATGNQFDVMATKAKGAQKVLEAKQLAQQYRATGQALIQNTEENIAKQHLTEAQTKHALAQANEANALAHFHRLTGGNARADRAAAADSSATRVAMEKFAKQHNLVGEKGLGQSIQTLGATLENAKAAAQNPMTQITILDNIIRDATHLGVRPQTLKLYQEHLGGLRAMGESKAQGWVNGTVGKKAWKTVVDHLQNQYAEKLREGQAANENFNRVFKGDKAYPFAKRAKETAAAGETDIFSQMPGFGGAPAAPSAAPSRPSSITTPDGRVHTLLPDGSYSK